MYRAWAWANVALSALAAVRQQQVDRGGQGAGRDEANRNGQGHKRGAVSAVGGVGV
jgi:hypothetical protein